MEKEKDDRKYRGNNPNRVQEKDDRKYAPSKALGGVVVLDCEGCLTQYVRIAIREGRTRLGALPCPADKCKVPMQESLLKNLATAADWKKHLVYNQERKITEKPLTRLCPQSNCDGIVCLSKFPQASDVGRCWSVQCKTCRYKFCANCASKPHQDKGCDQAGDKDYFKWKQNKNVKPCPGCVHHVQKIFGCSAMSCSRCKTKWCWTCGLATPSYRCPRCTKNYRAPQIYVSPALYNPLAPRRQTWGDFFFAAPADPLLCVLVVLVGCMVYYIFFAN